MNEFTKEELEDLEEFLSDAPEFFEDEDGSLFKLHEKLKNMIDNYCEHDSLKIDMGYYYEVYPCKKCGMRFE